MTAPRRPFGRSFGRRFSTIQPYTPSDSAPTDQHLDTLRQAPDALRQIMTDHRNALADARRQAEEHAQQNAAPDEHATWVRARLADTVPPIQQRTTQAVADLAGRTSSAYDTLQQRSAAALPQPASGVEGMLSRQAAWSRAQTLLDSGIDPQQVIDEANDPETLHALAEELPTVLRAKGLHPDAAQQIVDSVHDRLAEVAGEPAANARLAAREADVHMAGLEPLLTHARGEAAGEPRAHADSGIGAAVAAQQARDHIAAGRPLATDESSPAPTGRDLPSALTRRSADQPSRLRHAINDQMRRAAGRPHAPTDAPNADPSPAA